MHLLREVTCHPGLPRQVATPVPASLGEPPPIVEHLTRREHEALRLLAGGATVDEIAEELTISVFTARNHVANVQRKLGARSRLETVLLGMRNGLI
jgi:DNA-binding CsgD family transcriptional regulator